MKDVELSCERLNRNQAILEFWGCESFKNSSELKGTTIGPIMSMQLCGFFWTLQIWIVSTASWTKSKDLNRRNQRTEEDVESHQQLSSLSRKNVESSQDLGLWGQFFPSSHPFTLQTLKKTKTLPSSITNISQTIPIIISDATSSPIPPFACSGNFQLISNLDRGRRHDGFASMPIIASELWPFHERHSSTPFFGCRSALPSRSRARPFTQTSAAHPPRFSSGRCYGSYANSPHSST